MQVGDRVKLNVSPVGWGGVTGVVVPHDDVSEQFVLTSSDVLVEWNNGETCYERLEALTAI